jgi:HEAT repeat protein
VIRTSILIVGLCAALAGAAAGIEPVAAQTVPGLTREGLADLLKRRDPAAVAELERRFTTSADQSDRQKIAVVLLSRRQGDQPYFDFLAGLARQAVASDAPFPYLYDGSGKLVPGKLAPQFEEWAAAWKLDPETAVRRVFLEYPMDVFMLGLANDPRAAEILLKGLESRNYLLVARAAAGLARLQHGPAIRSIIAAAEHAPAEVSELIARALVLFDDAAAQAAAERLIKDKQLLAALREHAHQELTMNIGDL